MSVLASAPTEDELKNIVTKAGEVNAAHAVADGYPYLRTVAFELANLYVDKNQGAPQKMAQTREMLRALSPAVIGVILGESLSLEITEDLRAGWLCLRCGEQKDSSGKCPVCSK